MPKQILLVLIAIVLAWPQGVSAGNTGTDSGSFQARPLLLTVKTGREAEVSPRIINMPRTYGIKTSGLAGFACQGLESLANSQYSPQYASRLNLNQPAGCFSIKTAVAMPSLKPLSVKPLPVLKHQVAVVGYQWFIQNRSARNFDLGFYVLPAFEAFAVIWILVGLSAASRPVKGGTDYSLNRVSLRKISVMRC